MKKYFLMAAIACCLGTTVNAAVNEGVQLVQVQEKSVFEGKWMTKVTDTPMGDYEFVAEIVKNDEGKLILKMAEYGEIELKVVDEKKITFEFSTSGVDIDCEANLVDEDTIKGSMFAGEFAVTFTRVKE